MTRTRLGARLALAVVTALVPAACGSKPASHGRGAAPGGGPGGSTVMIVTTGASWAFRPATVEVPAGTRVTWRNRTPVAHNVTFQDSSVPSSQLFNQDETYQATFASPGRYPYVCSIHPTMKGAVVVH